MKILDQSTYILDVELHISYVRGFYTDPNRNLLFFFFFFKN
jgi:hypothetical protein